MFRGATTGSGSFGTLLRRSGWCEGRIMRLRMLFSEQAGRRYISRRGAGAWGVLFGPVLATFLGSQPKQNSIQMIAGQTIFNTYFIFVMVDSPSSISISQLTEVLDTKIRQISMLKSLLTRELGTFELRNQAKHRVVAMLADLDTEGMRHAVEAELQAYQEWVLQAFEKMNEHYAAVLEKTKVGYQREIYELETELQKQYRLTRSMKSEVEELKGLVDCFVREKQAKVKSEPNDPVPTQSNPFIQQQAPQPPANSSNSSPSNSLPLIKAQNPILQIITQQDQNQSTKRQPQDEMDSPHLDMPRISIKEYITLQCLQNKLRSEDRQSPKFSCEFSKEILSCELEDVSVVSGMSGVPSINGITVLSDVAIERNIPCPPTVVKPTRDVSSGQTSPKHKKPARFFLEEFKKSFEKTLSENSIDRKDPGLNVSLNYENQDMLFMDESKKFQSSSSTPSNNNLGKVTFGKQKKFFSQIDQSQEQAVDQNQLQAQGQNPKSSNQTTAHFRKSFQPHPQHPPTRKKSKQPHHYQQQQQPIKNPAYNLVKKKLNYNSITTSNSGQHIKDKDRENSYSSRDKTSNPTREDRYKLLIRNILNIKEKENMGAVLVGAHGKRNKENRDGGGGIQQGYPLFVGDKKMEIKYQGAKRDGRRHGRGILFYSNGLSFQGEFRDGLRCGYGILKFNHIQIYNGDWQSDMLNGQGRIKNCSVISKKRRQPPANGSPQLHKWISYSGEFRDNKFHGTGTLFLQNGEKFLGKFNNGLAQGEGTFYKNNGEVEFGIWKNNVFTQKF